MAFTTRTKRAVGTPTRKDDEDASIDNEIFLYNLMLSLIGSREIITNGSFESDADSDGFPDGWTRTLYTGGSFLHDTSTVAADGKAIHGKRSVKFTSPGGGGNGGGYITSTDFFELSEKRPYILTWQSKSSVADTHNLVEILYYDCTQTIISTGTLYDNASANPTSWFVHKVSFKPPANTRYAKLRFTGAKDDDTTAGDVWFDNIQLYGISFENRYVADVAGSGTWTCPVGVYFAEFTVIGGGGGGGSNNGGGNDGGGGGGGGYSQAVLAVTPGTSYNFEVGAGGVGGSPGTNGAQSQIVIGATTLDANGGTGGQGDAGTGAGGAGGTASGGDTNTTGGTGASAGGGTGGAGGIVPAIGTSVAGSAGATPGQAGSSYGAGGSGAVNATGGAGHAGAIIFRW